MSGSTTYIVTIEQDISTPARGRLPDTQKELVRLIAKEAVEEHIKEARSKGTGSGHTNAEYTLPETGFVRLPQILEVIPIGKTCWWEGVKTGRFPKPVKLSARCTAWRAEDVRELIMTLSEQGREA